MKIKCDDFKCPGKVAELNVETNILECPIGGSCNIKCCYQCNTRKSFCSHSSYNSPEEKLKFIATLLKLKNNGGS